jgi:hypothetical protein
MLVLLPIFAAITWMASEITIRSMRLERAALDQSSSEALMTGITHRLRADIAGLTRRQVDVSADGRQLKLTLPDRAIAYTIDDTGLTREANSSKLVPEPLPATVPHSPLAPIPSPLSSTTQPAVGYRRNLRNLGLTFQLEPIGADTGLVWLKFAMTVRGEQGPSWQRPYVFAAPIGREVSR